MKKEKIFYMDAHLIGSSPFIMKELILRGYQIRAISSLSPEEQQQDQLNYQRIEKAVAITERTSGNIKWN